MESYASIFNIISEINPDECYHLAAQSYVSYSFEDEFSTININLTGIWLCMKYEIPRMIKVIGQSANMPVSSVNRAYDYRGDIEG